MAHPPTRSPSNRWLCATHIGQQSCRHRLRVKKARSASPFSRSIMLHQNFAEFCPRSCSRRWIWPEPLGRAARPSSTAQTPTATGPPWDTTAAIAEACPNVGNVGRMVERACPKLTLVNHTCLGVKENFWWFQGLDLGGFMSMPSGLSVIVGPKSLTLSYCCWQTLIVVML